MEKFTISEIKHLLLFFAVCIMISCGNASNQELKKVDSNSTAVAVAPVKTRTVDPRLDILYMESAQFLTLMPNPGAAKKCVFKHALTNERLGDFTLSAWREKSNRYETAPVYLKNLIDSETDLGDSAVLFGDQNLRVQQVADIRTKLSTDPSLKYLIFVPIRGTKPYEGGSYSVIFYNIHLYDKLETFESDLRSKKLKTLAPFALTNPSPPATALD